jgi:hypothetical protein
MSRIISSQYGMNTRMRSRRAAIQPDKPATGDRRTIKFGK